MRSKKRASPHLERRGAASRSSLLGPGRAVPSLSARRPESGLRHESARHLSPVPVAGGVVSASVTPGASVVWGRKFVMSGVSPIVKYLLIVSLLQCSASGLHYVGYQHDARPEPRSYQNTTEALYGQWTAWSTCSSTCGAGVSVRTRTCNKRFSSSRNGDPVCLGDTTEHKICKTQACPEGSLSPRAYQCSQYNHRRIAGQLKKWLPVNEGTNPCELRCVADGLLSVFGKVADGTPCQQGVCLDGRCWKVGCDDKLGNGAEVDMCGMCSGRNITCVHYKGVFSEQPASSAGQERRSEYKEVVVVPVGSRNLEIRQRLGQNILAVRDRSTAILYHGKEAEAPNQRVVAGAALTYTREDGNRTEVIRTLGPISSELYVLVLMRERNHGVFYQYWIPLNQPRPPYYHVPVPSHTTKPYQSHTTHRPRRPVHSGVSPQTLPPHRHGEAKTTPEPYHKTTLPPTSTTAKLNYGPKRRGLVFPQYVSAAPSSPSTSDSSDKHFTASDSTHTFTPMRNNLPPVYHRNYRTRKPVYNYYERFRNASYRPAVNVYRNAEPLPPQTQRDSSSSNGVEAARNIRHNSVKPEKDKKAKFQNFTRHGSANKNLHSRWKYNINGNVNDSGRQHATTPVSIAVLPLPDTKYAREKHKGIHHKSNSRPTRGESCPPCQRVRDQTKHFCTSDFVIRASVTGYDFIHGETRYELEILQSFKNTFPLLSKEYVWSPDTCRCPKLRSGKEYVLMGRSDNNYRRNESRLLVDRNSFVRSFNHKYSRRLLRLRKNQDKKCSSKVS